jgi:hypothetical protein
MVFPSSYCDTSTTTRHGAKCKKCLSVKALQEEEGEGDMHRDLDEKWAMEMWTEFDIENEGMVGCHNAYGRDR